jgi:hypothetical protein
MPDSDNSTDMDQPLDLRCGNCGVAVHSSDITCPACGVLLAAYQAPAGSSAIDSSATHEIPSPSMVPDQIELTAPSPAQAAPANRTERPVSQSPIGDALRRERGSLSQASAREDRRQSAETADELAQMATNTSDFAKEVDADLAGAKVTFDHGRTVIEANQADITRTPEKEPSVVVERPAPPKPTPVRSQPVRAAEARPQADSGHVDIPTSRSAPDPTRIGRWIPYIIFGCVFLGFTRSFSGTGLIMAIAIAIFVVFLIMKATKATSRKTTSMPRDTSWKGPRRR